MFSFVKKKSGCFIAGFSRGGTKRFGAGCSDSDIAATTNST
jgi:hypothetical protein